MAVDTELLRQNLIYGEISGNAVVSLNYQRMLSKHYAIRVGYGAWVINDNETSGNPLAIPTSPVLLLLIQYVFDKFFEMGIGKNIRLKSDDYYFWKKAKSKGTRARPIRRKAKSKEDQLVIKFAK